MTTDIKKLARSEIIILAFVFATSIVLRIFYLHQFSSSPLFSAPQGDPLLYFKKAQEIMGGNWLGKEISFHSSPPYPYLMALIFTFSRNSFALLYAIQIIIGSVNCVLIYFLARELCPGQILPPSIAGFLAAFYGTFVFFEGSPLMISLTVFFTDLSLLLVLLSNRKRPLLLAAAAGAALGIAILDKPNILLFVPVAAVLLFKANPPKSIEPGRTKGVIFCLTVFLTLAPFTYRNYAVSGDFVLVSANGGVNFFIGNNPEANGTFFLPPDSGLSDTDLFLSSSVAAERALDKTLTPSQVSRYWFAKGLNFLFENQGKAVKLYWEKVRRLFNYFEVPNYQNYYFVRTEYAPVLKIMFSGFWIIAPLGILGIFLHILLRANPAGKLYLGFILVYTLSLIPFFITARYRLPVISLLIVFASFALARLKQFGLLAGKSKVFAIIVFIAALFFVNQNIKPHFSYAHDRNAVGSHYYLESLKPGSRAVRESFLEKSISQLKQSIEIEPDRYFSHFNLGLAFEAYGFYSGSLKEYERTVQLNPEMRPANEAIARVKNRLNFSGDKRSLHEIPLTPYEKILLLRDKGQFDQAIDELKKHIRRDPYHYLAINTLGEIYANRGSRGRALRLFKRGLKLSPGYGPLSENLKKYQ